MQQVEYVKVIIKVTDHPKLCAWLQLHMWFPESLRKNQKIPGGEIVESGSALNYDEIDGLDEEE